MTTLDRTRVLYGICRVCKAVCERHVAPSAEEARVLKIALLESDLIPRDLNVEDIDKWPVTGCAHHPAVKTPAPRFPAAKDGD